MCEWWPQQVSVGKDDDDNVGGVGGDDEKDKDAETGEMYVLFSTYMSYFLQ